MDAFDIGERLAALPQRIHEVVDGHAAAAPDAPALVDGDVIWNYHELYQRVRHIATELRSLGIRPGDRMMIVSENTVSLAALLLAASRADAWAIVVNPRLSPRELDQIRDHSTARRVFVVEAGSQEAAGHAARYRAELRDIGPLTDVAVSALQDDVIAEPVEVNGRAQVAVLIYTSGTTGAPKGVMLSHENLLISAEATAWHRRMDAHDRVYLVLPMSHIVGISVFIMTLMAGGTVRLVSKYDPAALADAIADGHVTILNGVPAVYQKLLEHKVRAGIAKLGCGSLRLMTVAGAPLDLALKSRVESEFGLPLLNAYGTTECSPGIAGVRLDAPRADDSVGLVLPGIDTRVIGRDGSDVADGAIGELHVRGPNVMLGYYRAPDLTANVKNAGGWLNTGDLVRFEGQHLFVVGRTKELIIRSGFNVYPAEVEAVLNAHEAVLLSAVIGRAVDGNEEVVAFVQLIRGASASRTALAAYAAERLTPYKRPSDIVIVEELPATSAGKVLKHRLAELFRQPQ